MRCRRRHDVSLAAGSGIRCTAHTHGSGSSLVSCASQRASRQRWRARFRYCIQGRPLRASLYPPRTVLYRKDRARYRDEGHGHRVQIDGPVLSLRGPIYHDDRKPLARWFLSQQRYARREAEHLLKSDRATLSKVDQIRLAAWPAPMMVLLYTLFAKGCLLDGWSGWYYALQRMLAEVMICLEIIDRRLRPDS